MTTYKNVNGTRIEMTAGEEATFLADQAGDITNQRNEVKMKVLQQEKIVREGGVSFGGNTYNAYDEDFARLLAAEKTTKTVQWKTQAGVYVTLANQDVIDLAELVSDFIHDCHNKIVTLDGLIDASETPDTVDITTGWPSTPYSGA
jgi:hypothetical protein